MKVDDLCKSVYSKIIRYQGIINKKNAMIADIELEIDALNEAMLKCVREIVTPLSERMLDKAALEQHAKDDEERAMFEFVEEDITDRFFNGNKGVRLIQILHIGSYDYDLRFVCENIKFSIIYPNTKGISKATMESAYLGKYGIFYEERPTVWKCICFSYDENECAAKIAEFIAKRKEEQNA